MVLVQKRVECIVWDGGKVILQTNEQSNDLISGKVKPIVTHISKEEVLTTLNRLVKTYLYNDSLGYGKDKPLAIQLLAETVRFLEELKLTYFIISGTLLGHIRHGDILPWDDDIDLIVDSRINEILEQSIQKYPSLEYTIKYGILKFSLKGTTYPFIDLFTSTINGSQITFFDKKWDTKYFFPTKKVKFMETIVSIPRIPDHFLKNNYGNDYMNTIYSGVWNHRKEKYIFTILGIRTDDYNRVMREIKNTESKLNE